MSFSLLSWVPLHLLFIIKITIIFRYLSSAVIIALMLVGPSKYLKKILYSDCTRNLTGLKIPTGRRQNSWLFTSVAENLNLRLPYQIQLAVRVGLELGPLNCKSSALTTWPHCLLQILCIFSKCPR